MTPFALVRRFKKQSFTFIFGLFCVALAFGTTQLYVSKKIYTDGWGPGNLAWNKEGMSSMVGYSIYISSAVGIVIPIYKNTAVPEKFPEIIMMVQGTQTAIIILLGIFCSTAFGKNLN